MAKRNPDLTRLRIIEAATEEFADKGYDGARVDRIVERAGISKNLLYHHYGSKDGLFIQVLEHHYTLLRNFQNDMQLKDLDPVAAITNLTVATFQYFIDHRELVSLLNTENLHQAGHVKRSKLILDMYHPLAVVIQDILDRGVEQGLFRSGVDPVELYITISGLGYYYLCCQYTLSTIFRTDLSDDERVRRRCNHIVDVVLAYLTDNGERADGPSGGDRRNPSRL